MVGATDVPPSAPTSGANADALLDEPRADHVLADSVGEFYQEMMDQAIQSGHTTDSVMDVLRMILRESIDASPTANSVMARIDEAISAAKQKSITKGDADHTHLNNTSKQTLKEFTANNDKIELVMDMNALAQLTTVTIEEKTDGTTYRIVASKVHPTDFDGENVIVELNGKGLDQKVTLTSGTGEGSSKNIPYNWVEENRA